MLENVEESRASGVPGYLSQCLLRSRRTSDIFRRNRARYSSEIAEEVVDHVVTNDLRSGPQSLKKRNFKFALQVTSVTTVHKVAGCLVVKLHLLILRSERM